MAKQIGERFELSEDTFITLYYDGSATLVVPFSSVTLDAAEVAALRRAFATQDVREARATLEAMRDELTTEPGFPPDYNPKDL